ncbi:MAG: mechanosensitive ion channel family protein [Acidimicrobiia bacterium]|nr:mechanosensitive ion channel family protein [Acidimicrobiia bacterium]
MGAFDAQEAVEEIVPEGLTAGDWIQAGALVAGALLVAVVVHRLVVRVVTAGWSSRLGVARLIGRFAGMAVFVTGLVYALNTLGVRIGPLLGALGIVGIALAFALRDILENFVAGVILQARNPFRYGDQIESGEWQGTVTDVNFRSVVLRTVDGTRVEIPSATVLKDGIQNLTAFDHRRTTVVVGVAYGTDLRVAAEVIGAAVGRVADVTADPAPEVLLEELAESSVNFAVRFWHLPDIASMWRARDGVILAVYEALGEAGIEIPFPQRVLSFPEPLRLSGDGADVPGSDRSSPSPRDRGR